MYLFVLGRKPGLREQEWHLKRGEKYLPDDVLVCAVLFLRALLLSNLICQKPGNLERIYLKGPLRYYEFLLDEDDLSSLKDASAQDITARFALTKKDLLADPGQGMRVQVLRLTQKLMMRSKKSCCNSCLKSSCMQRSRSQAWLVGRDVWLLLKLIWEGVGHRLCIFDNFTHHSGQPRGFIACEKHSDCRLYTFVRHHGSRRRTAAFLLAWQMRAAHHRRAAEHKADKPSTEQLNAMMLRISS